MLICAWCFLFFFIWNALALTYWYDLQLKKWILCSRPRQDLNPQPRVWHSAITRCIQHSNHSAIETTQRSCSTAGADYSFHPLYPPSSLSYIPLHTGHWLKSWFSLVYENMYILLNCLNFYRGRVCSQAQWTGWTAYDFAILIWSNDFKLSAISLSFLH